MSSNSNYKLTASSKETLGGFAEHLLARNVRLHESGCPLGFDDIVRGVTTEEDRSALAHLRHKGYYCPDNNMVPVHVAGVDIVCGANFSFRSLKTRFPYYSKQKTEFNLDTLDPDKYDAFVTWVNRAVRAKRIAERAKQIATTFTRFHCGDSLASMRCRWPAFMAVPLSMDPPWPERVRHLTTIKLKQYEWPGNGISNEWYVKHLELLEIVGGLLAGAQLITVPESTEIASMVVDWDHGKAQ